MKYSVVVLDLDGTLLRSDKSISERTRQAVVSCAQSGMVIIYATARPPRAVKVLLPEQLRSLGSFVYYNGAYVTCERTGLEAHLPIPAELTAEVLDYCLNVNPDLDISLEVRDEWISLKPYDLATLTNVHEGPLVTTLPEMKAMSATKILFTGELDRVAFLQAFAGRLNILITDGGTLVQVSSTQAAKEHAVAALCEAMDVAWSDVIAFGDDFNDLGLFKLCGRAVAMGNAIEELKALAQEVTDTNDNDGVAQVLEGLMRHP